MLRSLKSFLVVCCLMLPAFRSVAQVSIADFYTASQLANYITGAGIVVYGATLTCADSGSGEFRGVSTALGGIDSGIILTSGYASTQSATGPYGANGSAVTMFADNIMGRPGDATLAALAGVTLGQTYDACILEFNFVPTGDTVSFKYVFGSEEYFGYACSQFNDVFGFFISGGAYATPTNIALVPGTTLPVCVNTINCGAGTHGVLDSCTIYGSGAPFCTYYTNNLTGTTITYRGLTTVLSAIAAVSPCDTYHLKIGVADTHNARWDSGVFIEANSFSANTATTTALSVSGIPFCVRGCSPGRFVFTQGTTTKTTPTVVHFNILGTAVNGTDYTTIADSAVIPAFMDSVVVNINGLSVPPTGAKIVTLQLIISNPCGGSTTGASASITILDPFFINIITPDTSICQGQVVDIRAVGDTSPYYNGLLSYLWSPSGSLNYDTTLTPIASPTVSTVYTLTANALSALGCPALTQSVSINVVPRPVLTTTAIINTCVSVAIPLTVNVTPSTGTYAYSWSPGTDLSSASIPSPIFSSPSVGTFVYTVTVSPVGVTGCSAQDTTRINVINNTFTLENPDTTICRGQFVQVLLVGGVPGENFTWSPPSGVSNTATPQPMITPTATAIYSVTGSIGTCPPIVQSFMITVDTPATSVTLWDTVCLGQTVNVNLSFPGSGGYSYTWTPATYLSSTLGSTVVINPTAIGDPSYDVTVSPLASPAGCTIKDHIHVHVAPGSFTLANHDTLICRGQEVFAQVLGSPDFTWLWTPATGVSAVNSTDPTMTPTVTTTYTVTAMYESFCAISHEFTILVDTPAPVVTIYDTICLGMSDHINLTFPGSSSYIYKWTPGAYLSDSTSAIVSITPTAIGNDHYIINVYPAASPAGCLVQDVVQLHVAPNDFTLWNNDTAICLGQSVQAIVTGSSEFLYTWTPTTGVSIPNITDPVLSPTVSTMYTITATYAPHCPDMQHHFFIEVDTLAHPVNIIDTICLLVPDSVNLAFPNSNTYKFTWLPTPPALNTYVSDSTSSVVALIPTVMGTYNWIVNISPAAKQCDVDDNISLLVVPNSFVISPTVDTVCVGTPVQVIGVPYPLFNYQWVPTIGVPLSNIINPLITVDTSTTYVVTATFNKCPPMRDTLRILVQPNPVVFIGGDRYLCEYDTLHISAQVFPNWFNDYSYSWTPPASFDNPSAQNVVYLDTVSEKIVVNVNSPHGCTGSDSAFVTVFPGNFLSQIPSYAFCPGDSTVIIASGAKSYLWMPPLYLSDTLGDTVTLHPLTSMIYTVIGTSAQGCKDTVTFPETVHPHAVIYMPDSVRIYPGETYVMNPETNGTNFQWYPTYGLDNSNQSNATASPAMTTKYYLTTSTEWGCASVDSITIIVDPNSLISVPNAFTPGALSNTEFKIILRGMATLNYLRIFNRWGEMIFETKDINEGWDGKYKAEPQPFGVYVYLLEATTSQGTVFSRQGNITLIR